MAPTFRQPAALRLAIILGCLAALGQQSITAAAQFTLPLFFIGLAQGQAR